MLEVFSKDFDGFFVIQREKSASDLGFSIKISEWHDDESLINTQLLTGQGCGSLVASATMRLAGATLQTACPVSGWYW